ncbi:MAG: flagellar biosynthesis protein FliQ [Paracoccaceae bacterium]|uniref:flagellar biosynthesis protein FliQ n=1 Tax=Seohaeicola saemankumensis TaxID=481181 RepID=UPI001E5D6A9D|nr:flagellar biosynthesis protein FliQ [Seohaeicola saemankumensis]MCD1625105.1 flagellar biosynthesis protein FliQ [Seohaeicola saemankumensis]
MEFGTGIEHLQLAYLSILKTAGPILAVALAVGLLIGILQAATSINEATLSFVPKLVIVFITMALISSYMLTTLTDYFLFVFDSIRSIR